MVNVEALKKAWIEFECKVKKALGCAKPAADAVVEPEVPVVPTEVPAEPVEVPSPTEPAA